jgi:hypothetical protein
MEPNTRSRRTLVGIGVAVAVLVVLAVALALQPPHEFDSDSPEGTAQGCFRAVLEDDEDQAPGYLTGALRDGCSTAPGPTVAELVDVPVIGPPDAASGAYCSGEYAVGTRS